ncbi:MAG: phosphatidylserine decarboxylase [Planctomycetes bacterium]|nr:phosphatidylserine decarboxylase [Planctomycetota bacterium]
MLIAKEGLREIVLATLVLGVLAAGAVWLWSPLAGLPLIAWIWVLSFFRDPPRRRTYAPGELCSPADGTVTEVSELEGYEGISGPVLRIGIFLSLFNVHVNRSACSGRVRRVHYRRGEFLDARHPESGSRNESNTLWFDPDPPLPGPVVLRQVAGLVARRIICHAQPGDDLPIGARFGMIKFGSRTELIIPRRQNTEILVGVGDRVRGGLTILARQPLVSEDCSPPASERRPAGPAAEVGSAGTG